MRARIFYYSLTGNTKRVAEFIEDFCQDIFEEVSLQRIEVIDEDKLFLKQALFALLKKEKSLKPLDLNLEGWDIFILGSPLWAFTLPCGVRSFLKSIDSLRDKKVIFFLTYGSGLGVERCLREVQGILKRKEAEFIKSLAFSQSITPHKDRILGEFKGVMEEMLSEV